VGPKTKKFIAFVVIAFFAFIIFTNPERAAEIVANIWGLIVAAFNAIVDFFNALLNQ
jgi:hypothetical protein